MPKKSRRDEIAKVKEELIAITLQLQQLKEANRRYTMVIRGMEHAKTILREKLEKLRK